MAVVHQIRSLISHHSRDSRLYTKADVQLVRDTLHGDGAINSPLARVQSPKMQSPKIPNMPQIA